MSEYAVYGYQIELYQISIGVLVSRIIFRLAFMPIMILATEVGDFTPLSAAAGNGELVRSEYIRLVAAKAIPNRLLLNSKDVPDCQIFGYVQNRIVSYETEIFVCDIINKTAVKTDITNLNIY